MTAQLNTIPTDLASLSKAPTTAGVYLFYKGKTPLYIGKSVNIRARLKSHFESAKQVTSKAYAYVNGSDHIQWIITDSEFKALMLESRMIRTHRPKYNVRWRDDKSYLYIKITKEVYPKISVTHEEKSTKAYYYGPFSSKQVTLRILKEIRRVFPFCMQTTVSKQRCFYSKIGLCDPCPNIINRTTDTSQQNLLTKQYKSQIRNVKNVLEGKSDTVLKMLLDAIDKHKEKLEYEEALIYRNRYLKLEAFILRKRFDSDTLEEYNTAERRSKELKKLLERYIDLEDLHRIECYDMSTLSFKNNTASMVVFTDGLSDKKEYKRFKLDDKHNSDFDMFGEVMERRFKRNWEKPNLVIVDGGKPQVRKVLQIFATMNVSIPLIGIAKRPDRIILGTKDLLSVRPPKDNIGFRLVQALRDESHRFAKKYHVYLRTKNMI
ncbi:MAG: GIY-YIG nuclease family protein [bacterium]|nr:GIY-YIG nuclease family protein [bacterium]